MLTSVDVKFTSIVHLFREIVHKGLLRSANILQIADVVRRVDFSLFLLCFQTLFGRETSTMSARQFRHFAQTTKTTQPHPQVSSVNGSIWQFIEPLTSFWRHRFNVTVQPLVMVNYACGFTQSGSGKYFEWIINNNYSLKRRWLVP